MSRESELLTEKELLPCPFCGCDHGNLYFVTMDQRGYETLGIFCDGCKQTTILEENEWEGDTASARKRAIDAWNQRMINNQINLCDSCKYLYPACPSGKEKDDVIFGNGIGNDNICACNKYDPLKTKEDE